MPVERHRSSRLRMITTTRPYCYNQNEMVDSWLLSNAPPSSDLHHVGAGIGIAETQQILICVLRGTDTGGLWIIKLSASTRDDIINICGKACDEPSPGKIG
jgi:hypothetical protein